MIGANLINGELRIRRAGQVHVSGLGLSLYIRQVKRRAAHLLYTHYHAYPRAPTLVYLALRYQCMRP